MWLQMVNQTDVERVWVSFTNSDGLTITAHYPVVKILKNTASISTNEAATKVATFGYAGLGGGLLIGLAYDDVANGAIGVCQIYGYHESALIAPLRGDPTNHQAVTIRPGVGMTYDLTTVGLNSVGADATGPVVAMDTIGGGGTSGNAKLLSANLSTAGQSFADHVFIRAL